MNLRRKGLAMKGFKKMRKKSKVNEQTIIVLNSNDLMLFDKTSLSAKAGKNIRLVLNHTGKIGKEFMGHNFVLLKKRC